MISTVDVWSDARLELQAGAAGGIRGTKFCISGTSACEIWWGHVAWKHGQKLPVLNNGNLPAISWISLMNVGHAECCIGNLWKRTSGTSSNELDHWVSTIFSIEEALAWLEAGGWPIGDGGVRLHQIWYTVDKFVTEFVHNFLLIVLRRALRRPALSTCEPPLLYFTCMYATQNWIKSLYFFNEIQRLRFIAASVHCPKPLYVYVHANLPWWSISCHSGVQAVPRGARTIDTHNFRKWVSKRLNLNCTWRDVRQRNMSVITQQIQSTVNALQWKHLIFCLPVQGEVNESCMPAGSPWRAQVKTKALCTH